MGSGPTGLQFVTSGTYQREVVNQSGLDLVVGTEAEIPELATNIVCTEDALLSWVRMHWAHYSHTEAELYEWFVIKCQSSDGIQDLSSATVVEDLQRLKKIFGRGVVTQCAAAYGKVKVMKLEFFQVKLNRGEELRLVLRPILANTASAGKYFAVLEWRQVGA